MWCRKISTLSSIMLAISLSGCGTKTPLINNTDEPHASAFLVNRIINHVKCEMRHAIRYVVWYDTKNASEQPDRKRRIAWIDGWGAKLSIKLVIKEKSSTSPSLSLVQPLENGVYRLSSGLVSSAQSFTLGLGGSASAESTRTVNLEFFYDFASEYLGRDFDPRTPPQKCITPGVTFEDGDLRLAEFVDMATFPFFIPGNVSAKPPSATSQQISFVTAIDGNVTPTWKFVRVTSSGGAPGLFAASRSDTSDLIVSIGPTFGGTPSAELDETHFLARQQSALLVATQPRN